MSMAPSNGLDHMRNVLCYVMPATVFIYYILASTISIFTLQNMQVRPYETPFKVLLWLMILVALSFGVEALMLVVDTISNEARYSSTGGNFYALSNVLVWMILAGGLDSKMPVWYPHCGAWLIALIAEATLLILRLSYGSTTTAFVHAQTTIRASRILILALLSTIRFTRCSSQTSTDPESSPLLNQSKTSPTAGQRSKADPTYGSISKSSHNTDDEDEDEDDSSIKKDEKRKKARERLLANGNWFNYVRSFSMFVPLLLPAKSRILQFNLFVLFICLACGRAVMVLEPRQLGIVFDRMSTVTSDADLKPIMSEVILFVFYRWMEGVLAGPVERLLWRPIEQNAERSLQTAAYNHIMDLSRDFHTEKQSGELYTSISQGSSIINILDTVIFQILPVFIDLVLAAVYLFYVFGPYIVLALATTSIIFFWQSNWFLSRQKKIHRKTTKLARKKFQFMYDSVGNWESVSHFNAVSYEKERYSIAVGSYLIARLRELFVFYMSWMSGDSILELGLVCATFLAVYQIAHGTVPIGSFAMLTSYWASFTTRLYQLMHTRRRFLEELIDAEALRELFERESTVKDGSVALEFKSGTVEFHGVSFSYDGGKNILNDFNLRVESGQNVALVGETGGGKSTVLKLIFRFYDAQKGRITIDDQDTKSVTLQSLRNYIGVVPQDPSLFNTTIMENVRYSKLNATDEEVMEACKAAAIHDKIIRFPKGYSTMVGEKGVKLSGGEQQRIAIARVILKEPKIILLDEATSAVDSETEGHIQDALRNLVHGRTTFTVAHRLSTVSDADMILVIKEGCIVERGPPHLLLKAKGKYFDLWTKQIGTTDIASNVPTKSSHTRESSVRNQYQDGSQNIEGSATSTSNSLRATAPEFLPRNDAMAWGQREMGREDGKPLCGQGTPGHQGIHQSTSVREMIQSDIEPRVTNSKPHHITSLVNASEDNSGMASSADRMDETQYEIKAKKKGCDSSFQWRRNNKSLPSGPVDRLSDGPSTTRVQPRRVSTPSNTLPGMTRARAETHGRRRRQRRWRRRDNKSALT